jgi:adenosylhomocysteinase
MPLLAAIEGDFIASGALSGARIAMSIHLEAKTARLARLFARSGAEVYATGSNPLSTQDDVCAALAKSGVEVFAIHNAGSEEYQAHLQKALTVRPNVIIDDGGELISIIEGSNATERPWLIGGCEETTTGINRLRVRAEAGLLSVPMFNVNDAKCKHLFDNRYGTGQSVWDAIMRTTNLCVAGSIVVVGGYGWCGKGVALRAKALGARRVIVTEIDPIAALEAAMEGYEVMPMAEAAPLGDFFITVTGCCDVIGERVFDRLKDGAILANAGHFDVEVNVSALRKAAMSAFTAREHIEGFKLRNGRTVYLLAEGRLVNLAAGNGHPVEIMDMSFALQAMCVAEMYINGRDLPPGLFPVPEKIDREIATKKLAGMGIKSDRLTKAQRMYIAGR